ncbi:serine/threonine-protein kinase [Geitlerinema sp. PCC 9228]|jgi:serine/threonine-protein kinase|uniref:serine/threonine-protein kinase n=1 Tax=Geitlerinema sp. PCC 9228 TaxID=111611 RepID=UPI0008F9A29F|nr:serine/threonine-protein kinase [Geitlerinema sp. PCC 9228]
MSYCVNPICSAPENPEDAKTCRACGGKLTLNGRYRVLQALGQGGFGATFLGRDRGLPGNPICVLKQLRPAATSTQVMDMARELFFREATTLGKVGDHPQVPRLLDYFEENTHFYLVQEYVEGATLKQEVKREGVFSEEKVKQVLYELLPLLKYLHGQEVIHRDIKPANILRRQIDNRLVLIDFGAVKDRVTQTAIAAGEQSAFTSFAIGTPGFAPPEQMALRPVYGSDLYALGVTCLFLLTGQSPKKLGYDPNTGEIHWKDKVSVSPHLENVLAKMLEISVRDRFQSAEQVLQALQQPPRQAPPPPPQGKNDNQNDDDLSQGLVTNIRPPSAREETYIAPEQTHMSQVERQAQSIRARRDRSDGHQTGDRRNHSKITRSPSQSQPPATQPQRTGRTNPPTSALKRMDAHTLRTAYRQGKRDFVSLDLSGVNLAKANLSSALFHQSKLIQANLQGADLSRSNFSRARLNKAKMRNANLTESYLGYANLAGADLRGATLTDAYMRYANLRDANLCGADLSGANVTEEQIAMAKTNWLTVKPYGKR